MGLEGSLIKPIRYILFIISFRLMGLEVILGPLRITKCLSLELNGALILGLGPIRSLI